MCPYLSVCLSERGKERKGERGGGREKEREREGKTEKERGGGKVREIGEREKGRESARALHVTHKYSVKRDLVQCQERPSTVSKET
jgi:hypothetical protein